MTKSKFKNYFFIFFITLFFYHASAAQTSSNTFYGDLKVKESAKIKALIPYIQRFSSTKFDSTALILSIIKTESNFDEVAVSSAGALGLMQLMPTTAHQEYLNQGISWPLESLKENLIRQPELNLAIGIKHLERLQRQYANIKNPRLRLNLVLAAYNAGHTKVRRAFNCKNTSCVTSRINQRGSQYFGQKIKRLPFETQYYIKEVNKNLVYYNHFFPSLVPTAT